MNALRNLALAAALALAVAACSNNDTTPGAGDAGSTPAGTSDPAAASSPHQQEATGEEVPAAPTTGETDPSAAATPAQEEAVPPAQ